MIIFLYNYSNDPPKFNRLPKKRSTIKDGVSWFSGNHCRLAIVLWLGYIVQVFFFSSLNCAIW